MKQLILTAILLMTNTAFSNQCPKNTWSWGPPLPTPKTSRVTTTCRDTIITVGGTYWVTTADDKDTKIWSSAVHQWNTKQHKWNNLPDYPVTMGYAFAACVNDKLYVIGGRNQSTAYAQVFTLDLSSKSPTWIPGPSLPKPRWQHTGAVIGKKIYIISGKQGQLPKENAPAPDIIALDTSHLDKGWQFVTDLPAPEIQWQQATACNGKIYIFGGLADIPDKGTRYIKGAKLKYAENYLLPTAPLNQTFSFDPAASKWKTLAPLPVPNGSGACIAIDDRQILIAGGIDLIIPADKTPDGRPRINFSTQCRLYDTATDTYKPFAPLTKAVCDMGLVYVDGTAYVIGGESNPFKSRTDLVQIYTLKPK